MIVTTSTLKKAGWSWLFLESIHELKSSIKTETKTLRIFLFKIIVCSLKGDTKYLGLFVTSQPL